MSVRHPIGLLAVLLVLALSSAAAAAPRRVALDDGLVAALGDDGRILLEATPRRSEGLYAFAERLCGSRDAAPLIREENGAVDRLLAGVRYRVPLACLQPTLQRQVFEALFPDDLAGTEGWTHRVRAEGSGLPISLWRIAEWFTGNGQNFPRVRDSNSLSDEVLYPGQQVLIPAPLLLPALRTPGSPAATASAPAAVAGPAVGRPRPALDYRRDSGGEYAVYRLQPGEALYTSVVVRLTGHLAASDVNRLAGEIAEHSGIADVTDIPVGFEVKVPLDLLLPEFLPAGHPRRLEWEQNLEASDRFSNQIQAFDLAGITVILDAGHGGQDVGASKDGVWESVYVYDIMARVRRLLLESTAAAVLPTTRDGSDWQIPDRDVLDYSKAHAVLTDPPYPIEQGVVATNLRWYLANSLYRRALASARDDEKVIFVSIHADSLHPSLRGAMVYVPGLLPNPSSHGKSDTVYTSRREVREKPRVSFAWEDRVKSLGLSRQLGDHVLAGFEAHGLRVHDNYPVRDRVRKGRRVEYVPAVLRYNEVPAKILVEVCNLANAEDRRLIQTRIFRQRAAEAIVDGILRYYGYPQRRDDSVVAAAAR